MSRYNEGEADYANAGELWAANVARALAGKRGRRALRELREALNALPEKRLIARAMCTVGGEARVLAELPEGKYANREAEYAAKWLAGEREELRVLVAEQGEGVCAVGAYIWWQKVKAGASVEAAFAALPTLDDLNHDLEETAWEGKQAGLVGVLAWDLAFRNDEQYDHLSPEARYVAFLGWIDKELAWTP
jgi:hypothetical protein